MEKKTNSVESTERGEGPQVILEVYSEGGSMTLQGLQSPKGWMFQVTTDESALMDLVEATSDIPERPWVMTWRSALKQMDSYPWQFLYPHKVHPDFRQRVRAALKVRQKLGEIQWDDWNRVLSDVSKKS